MNTNRALIIILFETGYDLKTEKDEIDVVEFEDIVLLLNGNTMLFDWKEYEEGQKWENSMIAQGYEVRDIDDGSDSYMLYAIPSDKLSLIEAVAKYIKIALVVPEW